MKTIVVDRNRWVFGGERNEPTLGVSELKNSKGKMCCLGFACNQLGIPERRLIGVLDPGGFFGPYGYGKYPYAESSRKAVFEKLKIFLKKIAKNAGMSNNFTEKAMIINDSGTRTLDKREKDLIHLFSKNGLKLEFTGEYPKEVLNK